MAPDGLEWESHEVTCHGMIVPNVPKTQKSSSLPGSLVTKHDRNKASPRQKMVMCASKHSGPSGGYSNEEAIEGIDYVVHTVLPTDTLCDICLSYRVKATMLRQVNKLSGSTLLVSSKLVIPLKRNESGKIRLQDCDSPEHKPRSFPAEYPLLSSKEARANSELSFGDLNGAIGFAEEDVKWKRAQQSSPSPPTNPTMASREESNPLCVTLDTHAAMPAKKSPVRRNHKRWDRFRSSPPGEWKRRSMGTSTNAPVTKRPLVCHIAKKHDCKKVSPRHDLVMGDSTNHYPSGGINEEAVEGIDYVVHTVLPTDTLCGICLSYRIKATTLRQVNKFSGSTLLNSSKLVVPLKRNEMDKIRLQDRDSPEYKIHSFQAEYPLLSSKEARVYLELSHWDLDDAIVSAKDDVEWERAQQSSLSPQTNPTMELNPSCVTLDVQVAVPARTRPMQGRNQTRWDRCRSPPPVELEMIPLITHIA